MVHSWSVSDADTSGESSCRQCGLVRKVVGKWGRYYERREDGTLQWVRNKAGPCGQGSAEVTLVALSDKLDRLESLLLQLITSEASSSVSELSHPPKGMGSSEEDTEAAGVAECLRLLALKGNGFRTASVVEHMADFWGMAVASARDDVLTMLNALDDKGRVRCLGDRWLVADVGSGEKKGAGKKKPGEKSPPRVKSRRG